MLQISVCRDREALLSEDRSFIRSKWNKTSRYLLLDSENKLISRINSPLSRFIVPIFNEKYFINSIIVGKPNVSTNADNTIASTSTNTTTNNNNGMIKENNLPILLIHGYCSGIALWCKNFDALARDRVVYAFDLLGFGCSSRPDFPEESSAVERMWIESIEEWCNAMGLEKFILLGHSLGAYLSMAYSLVYPNRVAHLILVDPWGFSDKDIHSSRANRTIMHKIIITMFSSFSPLSLVRASGPLGLTLLLKCRPDIRDFFTQSVDENCEDLLCDSSVFEKAEPPNNATRAFDGTAALNYIYHINMRYPSGEAAFRALCDESFWPRNPMINRLTLHNELKPMTFIYGSESWIDTSAGFKIQSSRSDAYIDVKVIDSAGHQVYAQSAKEFNDYVVNVCRLVDENQIH